MMDSSSGSNDRPIVQYNCLKCGQRRPHQSLGNRLNDAGQRVQDMRCVVCKHEWELMLPPIDGNDDEDA